MKGDSLLPVGADPTPAPRWEPKADVKARLERRIQLKSAAKRQTRSSSPGFDIACAFHYAAVSSEELEPRWADNWSIRCIPAITNIAFACELYLKAILLSEGISARGHKLASLFARLPPAWSEIIADNYIIDPVQSDNNLRTAINSISSAFEDWRYVFENTGQTIYLDVDVLRATARAALIAILTRHPEWPSGDINLATLTASLRF